MPAILIDPYPFETNRRIKSAVIRSRRAESGNRIPKAAHGNRLRHGPRRDLDLFTGLYAMTLRGEAGRLGA